MLHGGEVLVMYGVRLLRSFWQINKCELEISVYVFIRLLNETVLRRMIKLLGRLKVQTHW